MRTDVPLAEAYPFLNHGPVTLVSTRSGLRSNVMAASWVMPLDFDPPKVAVVIERNTLTRELVDLSREFTFNIPPRTLADTTPGVGSISGRTSDKWSEFGLGTLPASHIDAPLIAGCIAWLECRVLDERAIEKRHDLFVAVVVAASADERVFSDSRWHSPAKNSKTLHYVAGGQFFTIGEAYQRTRRK